MVPQNLQVVNYKDIVRLPNSIRISKQTDADIVELAHSIKKDSLLNTFSAAVRHNAETGKTYYAIADGNRRYTAIGLLISTGDFPESFQINVLPETVTDIELLAMQLRGNLNVKICSKKEYARIALQFSIEKRWTNEQLAEYMDIPVSTLKSILKVLHLSEKAQQLVDAGKIELNKVSLLAEIEADLTEEERDEAYTQAENLTESKFKEYVQTLKANRPKGDSTVAEFVAIPHFVGVKKAQQMYDEIRINNDSTEFDSGYRYALEVLFEMDTKSISEKQAQFEEAKKIREEKTRLRKQAALDKAAQLLTSTGYNVTSPGQR